MRKGYRPTKRNRRPRTTEERLWAKVRKTEGCWEWTGARQNIGYGKFWLEYRNVLPHRVSYELKFGHVPDGMKVLHRCDNRVCVRPEHLFLGTLKENTQDCIRKGRFKPFGKTMRKDKMSGEANE